MFAPPTRPVFYPIISNDYTSVFRSLSNTVHKSLWKYFNIHKSTERGCCAFIVGSIKITWICDLRHSKTIYYDVTTKAPMDHIQLCYGGIHALNVVDLTSKILTYHGDAVLFYGYINMLENARKKVQQVQLPIPDVPS